MAARSGDGVDGFFQTLAFCWRRPGLLAVELAWRWSCGAFLLLLAGWQGLRIAEAVRPAVEATGIFRLSLESVTADPEAAAQAFAQCTAILQPPLEHSLAGLAPLALFVWAAAFALGRTALLRRYDARLAPRRFLLAGCEGLRLVLLAAVSWGWYAGMQAAGRVALGHGEPNLPLYAALVIALSLGLFALWSAVGWALLAAPLVGILGGLPFGAALVRSLRLRRARRRLLDVNLLMAVIKLALLVLAAVLSASPLPLSDAVQGWPLYSWYGFVTLLYLVASDFFKVARLLAFVDFCRGALEAPLH